MTTPPSDRVSTRGIGSIILALAIIVLWFGSIREGRTAVATIASWGNNQDPSGNYSGALDAPVGLTNAILISAGGAHNLALTPDGTVVGWGDNTRGQSTVPASLSNVIAVAAGFFHSLVLTADGTVVAWGSNLSGETDVPQGLSNVVAIAANGCDCLQGLNNSLALKSDGTVVGWGAIIPPSGLKEVVAISVGGNHGLALIRDGTVIGWGGQSSSTYGISNVVAIAAGGSHSLALKMDGTVVAWGNADNGQTAVPSGLSNVVGIAAGRNFSLALQENGTVAAWGDVSGGVFNFPPVLTNVISIAAGWQHGLALANDGSPTIVVRQRVNQSFFSGENVILRAGALGAPPIFLQWQLNGSNVDGATNTTLILTNAQTNASGTYTFIVSNALGSVTNVAARLSVLAVAPTISIQPVDFYSTFGKTASFSVAAVGSVPMTYQWQHNGTTIPGATNSALSLSNLTHAGSGAYSALVFNSAGVGVSSNALLFISPVVAWGVTNGIWNAGQSVIRPSLSNITAIAAGLFHSLGLRSDGTVTGWGSDTTSGRRDLTNFMTISAGAVHSLALSSNGVVRAWGSGNYGQSFVPSALASNIQAVAAGSFHNLVLRSNGTVAAWGAGTSLGVSPHFGQSIVPTNLSDVAAIAAGHFHSLALRADGTVVGWGWNDAGQVSVPPFLSGVVAIAAGGSNSLALKGDGTLVAWGDNTYGQATIPAGLSNVVAISVGAGHNVALKSDGSLVVWGLNDNKQTNVPPGLSNVMAISAGAYHSLALVNLGPPGFMKQPLSRTVFKGSSTTFGAAASGAPPLSYQWQFNNVDVPDQTNNFLLVDGAQFADAGTYRLIVSNSYGAVTSSIAQLTVNDTVPFFTLHPTDRQVLLNSNVLFVVSADGVPPLSYQWHFNGSDLVGQTNTTLVITNVQQGSEGFYSAVASNSFGVTTSSNAFLNVVDLVDALDANDLVWTNLTNVRWSSGTTITHDGIDAAASGPLVYPQYAVLRTTVDGPGTLKFWWMAVGVGSGSFLSFFINTNDQGSLFPMGWQERTFYLADGKNVLDWTFNKWNPSGLGPFAGYLDQVRFVPGPVSSMVLISPTDKSAPAGTNVTFTVVGGGTPPLSYQWQFAGTNLSGATAASLTLNNVQSEDAGMYTVMVSNGYGATNASASLTVNPSSPFIQRQASNQEMVRGGTVTFTVGAQGSKPLSYQWQFNNSDILGAINSSLTLSNIQTNHAGSYRVRVTNGNGAVVSSDATLFLVPTVTVSWGTVLANSLTPPPGLTNVVAISAGDNYSLALKSDNTISAWGYNSFGRLNVPAALTNASRISAGGLHSSAVTGSGTVVDWGDSVFDPAVIVPTGLSNVIDVAAGYRFNLALRRDGTVTAWGDNSRNQTNLPAGLANIVDVAAGLNHGLALQSDGAVVGWGDHTSGQTNSPVGLSNAVAIAAGSSYSMALQDNGSVAVWGNASISTNLPTDLNDVMAIAGGEQHALALRRDGTVVAWGGNGSGQTDVPSWLTNVVAISAGYTHSLALLNDGSPYITRHPWRKTISSGTTVEFNVVAIGLPPFNYQWQVNGTNIDGATNALLTLTNANLSVTGNYQCVVSNSIGTTTTLPAALTVLRSAPQFDPASSGINSDGTFRLFLTGLSGQGDIIIYASTNLLDWRPILTNPPAVGTLLITDPAATNLSQRFYWMREQ